MNKREEQGRGQHNVDARPLLRPGRAPPGVTAQMGEMWHGLWGSPPGATH
jgi:hypothetical protein